MRKVLLCLGMMAVAIICQAQKKQYNEALNAGRPAGQFYHWQNDKEKMIKEEKVRQYARENHYIIANLKTKEVGRFGDVAISVASVDFIPEVEVANYIAENITGKTPISNFSQKGTAFFYNAGDNTFKRYDDVLWTGEIRDGRIHGTGKGVKQLNATNYIAFNGTFFKGILQGEAHFLTYNSPSQYALYDGSRLSEKSKTAGRSSEGMTSIKGVNGNYGFINEDGVLSVQTIYTNVSDFSNGKALVKHKNYNYSKEISFYINKQGIVVEASDGTTTPASKIPANSNRGLDELLKNLKAGIENGESASAAVLDDYINGFANKELAIYLLTNSEKSGYDKYGADLNRLQDAYRHALNYASEGNKALFDDEGFSEVFYNFYTEQSQYDKQHKVQTAQELKDFCLVNKALNFKIGKYWYYPEVTIKSKYAILSFIDRFISLPNDRTIDRENPTWDYNKEDNDTGMLNSAIYICSNDSDNAFSSYYTNALSPLKTTQQQLEAKINKDRDEYKNLWEEIYRKKQRQADFRELSRTVTSPSWHAPKPTHDEEYSPLFSSNVFRKVEWSDDDYVSGTLFLDETKGWYIDTGGLFGSEHYYTTDRDILDALYTYKRWGIWRDVGEIK